MKITACGILATLAALPAVAEVTSAADNGFTTVNEVIVAATRDEAWQAALSIGQWWSSDHTISGDAARMSIDPVVQGCFCESLGESAGVVHLEVTTVMPETSLRLTGGLGPLGLMGVNGNMTWDFDETEDGTRIRFTYAVGGYMEGGLGQIAGPVDYVLGEALMRLKTYIETGNPEPASVE
jgi:uncharacterized protein YndB with AHSA1/START domain